MRKASDDDGPSKTTQQIASRHTDKAIARLGMTTRKTVLDTVRFLYSREQRWNYFDAQKTRNVVVDALRAIRADADVRMMAVTGKETQKTQMMVTCLPTQIIPHRRPGY